MSVYVMLERQFTFIIYQTVRKMVTLTVKCE